MSHPSASAFLRAQRGVISRTQALASGLTVDQVTHLLRNRTWTRLLPGIYLSADASLTWHTWAFAAILMGGPGAAIVGESAAALRAWAPQTLPITVAIPRGRRTVVKSSNICVIRLDVPAADRITVSGLPSTTRLRTAVDIAHLMPLLRAQELLDRMLVLETIALDDFTAAVAGSHRHGSAQARSLARSAADHSAAESERLARRIFREAGITGWKANHPVTVGGRRIKVDLALVHLKIAVEIKGWAFHSLPDRGRADDKRITDLQNAGWMVLPFGWYDLVSDPGAVVAAVLAAIALRSRATA